MTYAVLALMIALQVGQAKGQDVNNPIYRPVIKMCSGITGECEVSSTGPYALNLPRPRPQDLMPLVEPIPPECKEGYFCGGVPSGSDQVPTLAFSPKPVPGHLTVVTSLENGGRTLLTCEMTGSYPHEGVKNCELQHGATLTEVMQVIVQSLEK